jgi:hypothetical protein
MQLFGIRDEKSCEAASTRGIECALARVVADLTVDKEMLQGVCLAKLADRHLERPLSGEDDLLSIARWLIQRNLHFAVESVVSAPEDRARKASVRFRKWESPTLTKLNIASETKWDWHSALVPLPAELPPSPGAPTTKLGFSLEWAFPLSSRFEK